MLRTLVTAPSTWPERSGIIAHARTIPQVVAFRTFPVTFTWHFLERAGQRMTVLREEGLGRLCSRISAQVKATIRFYFQRTTVLIKRQGRTAWTCQIG